MYNAIFEKLHEMITTLRQNVTTVTGDFEAAQIKSFKANFPQARVCGCLFHYKAVSTLEKSNDKSFPYLHVHTHIWTHLLEPIHTHTYSVGMWRPH